MREGEGMAQLLQRERLSRDREGQVLPDPRGKRSAVRGLALALHIRLGLERRDLRHVEHVQQIDPIAGGLDAGVVVDREVPERVRGRNGGDEQSGEETGEDDQALHERASFATASWATGAQRREKCGFRSSAFWNQPRATLSFPRQRSSMPRWK